MTATQAVALEQLHEQFLKAIRMPLGVATRWHDRDEISSEDRAALLECLPGLEIAYQGMIKALAENGASNGELASWILAAQSFTRTIEAVENDYPAFVAVWLRQLAQWHEYAAQPFTLGDLIWNVREAKALLDRRYSSIEQHRADPAEYRLQQLEVAQDCGKAINEIATEIAPSAVAQWDRDDITEPVKSLVDSFVRWGEWRTNQPISAGSEIVAGARSAAVDAALLTLDQLLADAATVAAMPKASATIQKMSKKDREAKLEADVAAYLDGHRGEKFGIRDVSTAIGRSTGSISGSQAWKGRGKKPSAISLTGNLADTIPAASDSSEDEIMRVPRIKALEHLLSQVPRRDLAKMDKEEFDHLVDLTAESIAQADSEFGKHFQQRPNA